MPVPACTVALFANQGCRGLSNIFRVRHSSNLPGPADLLNGSLVTQSNLPRRLKCHIEKRAYAFRITPERLCRTGQSASYIGHARQTGRKPNAAGPQEPGELRAYK